jgi:hypothetical protein
LGTPSPLTCPRTVVRSIWNKTANSFMGEALAEGSDQLGHLAGRKGVVAPGERRRAGRSDGGFAWTLPQYRPEWLQLECRVIYLGN